MSQVERAFVDCLNADWPAPANVIAFTTTRKGGVSSNPFTSWNLAEHVGDSGESVAQNRQRLLDLLPDNTQLNWLEQVHGSVVCKAPTALQKADGLFTNQALQACCIMTADCLPILICSQEGNQVAALHAGWRGVAGRIIDQGLSQFSVPTSELMIWVGPSISARHFRVDAEVGGRLKAAMNESNHHTELFRQDESSSSHCYANLQGIVEQQCRELGIKQIYQSNCCSYSEPDRFFSYRRGQKTGRNVSLIVISD